MDATLKERRPLLSENTKRAVVDIIGYLFIALFIYAAGNKLFDYQKFKAQIGQSPMLTDFSGLLVWFIPTVELIIVLLLFVPRTFLIGLYAGFALMVAFMAYIAIMLMDGGHIPCNCGGILQNMSWGQHLIFNVIFVILGIVGILLKIKIDNKGLVSH